MLASRHQLVHAPSQEGKLEVRHLTQGAVHETRLRGVVPRSCLLNVAPVAAAMTGAEIGCFRTRVARARIFSADGIAPQKRAL
jgi:hypothetical protein